MQILHNGAPITDVTPGGAPIYVPGFEMVPAARSDAVQGMPGRMLQVRHDGVDIGNDRPAVINVVVDPAVALVTRGVGENSHVATFRITGGPAITNLPHRYWRVGSFTIAEGLYIAMTELQLLEDGSVVSGGILVTTDPVPQNLENLVYMTDGDISYAHWFNWDLTNSPNPYITFDLVTPRRVSAIQIGRYGNNFPPIWWPVSCKLSYSDDGVTWAEFGTGYPVLPAYNPGPGGLCDPVTFE
jgi:hypothetical protein